MNFKKSLEFYACELRSQGQMTLTYCPQNNNLHINFFFFFLKTLLHASCQVCRLGYVQLLNSQDNFFNSFSKF